MLLGINLVTFDIGEIEEGEFFIRIEEGDIGVIIWAGVE
jgi:hypothetical protein